MEVSKILSKIDFLNIFSRKNTSNNPSPFNQLPMEILDNIFSFLPLNEKVNAFPRVCKTFYAVSKMDHNRLIIKKIFFNFSKDLPKECKEKLINYHLSDHEKVVNAGNLDFKLIKKLFMNNYIIPELMSLGLYLKECKFSNCFNTFDILYYQKTGKLKIKCSDYSRGSKGDYRLRAHLKSYIPENISNSNECSLQLNCDSLRKATVYDWEETHDKNGIFIQNSIQFVITFQINCYINEIANKIFNNIASDVYNIENIEKRMSFQFYRFKLIKNPGKQSPFFVFTKKPAVEELWIQTINDLFYFMIINKVSYKLNDYFSKMPDERYKRQEACSKI